MIVWALLGVQLAALGAYHLRAQLRGLVASLSASAEPAAPSAPVVVRSSSLAWVRAGLAWAVAGATAVLVLALFAPYALGGSSFTVMSGSMTPSIRTGDVVIDQKIAAEDAKVGDVVTFRDPEGGRRLITHRVRKIRVGRDGVISFVTKGDAANAVQRWSVPAGGSIGLVRFRVPYLGYALWSTRQPLGRLILVVVPALLLAASELRRLWRPRPNDPSTERPGAAPL